MQRVVNPSELGERNKDRRDYLENYVRTRFLLERGRFPCSKTVSVQKVTLYKPTSIRRPLLRENIGKHHSRCIRMFTLILAYGSGKNQLVNIRSLFYLLRNADSGLIDELYCQILKQSNHDPSYNYDEDIQTNIFSLFPICSCYYRPSFDLEPHLLAYLNEVIRSPTLSNKIKSYSKLALKLLSFANKKREATMSSLEIASILDLQPVVIRVYLLNFTFLDLHVQSFTSVGDVLQQVHDILCVPKRFWPGFGLFETTNFENFVNLDDSRPILDVINRWCDVSQTTNDPVIRLHQLVYRVNIYMEIDSESQEVVDLFYIQCKHDAFLFLKPLPLSVRYSLTSLAMRVELGICKEKNHKIIQEFVSDYPLSAENPRTGFPQNKVPREVLHQIIEQYQNLTEYSKEEAEFSFVDYSKQSECFGLTLFPPRNSRDLPYECYLGISPKGVSVWGKSTREKLKSWGVVEIIRWEYNEELFSIDVGSFVRYSKMAFAMDSSSAEYKPSHISTLLDLYLQYHVQGWNLLADSSSRAAYRV